MKSPRLLQFAHDDPAAIRNELFGGFSASTAAIPPKYFYDALGSRLFSAITELPEYYPTRTEAAIFARNVGQMAEALGPVSTLVDLGAGNCEKAASLFASFRVQRYVAVDISASYLRDSLECLQRKHPAMDMLGIGLDFSQTLNLPAEVGDGPRTLFYPGSSIGNFTPAEALAFLRQVHAACQGGALLIGVDLVKPTAMLELAYDDPLGVTAAFNRNMLRHLKCAGWQRFRHCRLAPRRLLQQRGLTDRNASGGGWRNRAALAGGRAPLCAGRADSYREFLQMAYR
jgi:L-histidine N-alpha-methyltransferase